jgi:hypothetical protein
MGARTGASWGHIVKDVQLFGIRFIPEKIVSCYHHVLFQGNYNNLPLRLRSSRQAVSFLPLLVPTPSCGVRVFCSILLRLCSPVRTATFGEPVESAQKRESLSV